MIGRRWICKTQIIMVSFLPVFQQNLENVIRPDGFMVNGSVIWPLDTVRYSPFDRDTFPLDLSGLTLDIKNCQQDRYFRQQCHIIAITEQGTSFSLGEKLIEIGYLLIAPGAKVPLSYRQLEKKARDKNIGLWKTEKDLSPLPATPAYPLKKYGRVLGRVLSIGQTERAYYLNFGTYWREDMTVRLDRPQADDWEIDTVAITDLKGYCVEIIGLAESRDGPLMVPDYVEQISIRKPESCSALGQ